MKMQKWATALILVGLMTGAAQAQTADTTSTDTSTTTSASAGETIKQLFRSEFALIVEQEVHSIFQQVRSAMGLSDSTTDPLAMLESLIVNSISAVTSQPSSDG